MIVIALSFLIGADAVAQTINTTKIQDGYAYQSPDMRGATSLTNIYQFLNYSYAIAVLYQSQGRLLWTLPSLLWGNYNSPAYSADSRNDKFGDWDSPYPRRPSGGETGFEKHRSQ